MARARPGPAVWSAGPRCHYCGWPARSKDHIVPRKLCGLDVEWNVVPACFICNNDKGSEFPTCGCARCLWAIYRWERGERGQPRNARRKARKQGMLEKILQREVQIRKAEEELAKITIPNWMQ